MPAPDPSRSYPVELILSPSGEERPASRFDLTLRDLTRQGAFQAGVADLRFRDSDPLVDSLSAAQFLRRLDRDAGAGTEEGLAFGKLLLRRLLADAPVAAFWREMSDRRKAVPLHLQVVSPAGSASLEMLERVCRTSRRSPSSCWRTSTASCFAGSAVSWSALSRGWMR